MISDAFFPFRDGADVGINQGCSAILQAGGSARDFETIIADVNDDILPGITHWNHPNFMAYFNSTSSGPGILAELLSAGFNVNGMAWHTCPSATELEQKMMEWYKKIFNLPEKFWGIVYDTASVSSMHGIAAAREQLTQLKIREKGMAGRDDLPRLRIYASEQAHFSIDKAVVTLGFGLESIIILLWVFYHIIIQM